MINENISNDTRGTDLSTGKTKFERLVEQLPEIDYKSAMVICGDDEDFYIELFNDFAELPIKKQLADCIISGDCKKYCIHIHGFKNNAYSIGAKEIAQLAYDMETLSKEKGIVEEVLQMQVNLFKEYDRICECFINILDC